MQVKCRKCGGTKPRRHNRCAECFKKMSDTEKLAFESASKMLKAGTLRRWP